MNDRKPSPERCPAGGVTQEGGAVVVRYHCRRCRDAGCSVRYCKRDPDQCECAPFHVPTQAGKR